MGIRGEEQACKRCDRRCFSLIEVFSPCYLNLAERARYGVIVREVDDLYLKIARNLGIEVFVSGSKLPRMLECREIGNVLCIDLSNRVPIPLRSASGIYRHVEKYLKSEDVKEVVESSLSLKVEVLNTVIVYCKNEPRCEVLIDEEGGITINY